MAGKWLVFVNDVIAGPYTESQIRKMIVDGIINNQSKISREEEQIWKKVCEFDEFIPDVSSTQMQVMAEEEQRQQKPKKKVSGVTGIFARKNIPETDDSVKSAAEPVLQNDEVRFHCPECGQHYSASPSRFNNGEKIVCQVCSAPFMLSAPASLFASRTMATVRIPEMPAFVPQENVDFSEEIPEGDITCPHCWKTFSKENVCYISCHPDLLGDPIAGEFEQRRFVPTVYHSSGLPLDARGMPCTDMACPHCHLRIPASIVDLNSVYFSIAGAPSSGKSYFLTSMIHFLRKNLPEQNALSFYDVDPVINSVLNGYEDTIFMALDPDAVVSLPKTQQIGGDFSSQILKNGISFELPKPFIFRLQATQPSGGEQLDRNIVFYDNAGEHFQPGADSVANPATLHLSHSDGIVFLFDPLNDANMRKDCDQRDPQTELNTKVIDQTTLFAEMVNRIRRHGNLTSGQGCDIPLIIAVGKYDTWKNLIPRDISALDLFVENEEDFTAELDWNTVMDVSFMVREMMQTVAPAMVSQAESFFREVIFVPVSSFGCLASKAESGNIGIIPSQLNPIWVDIPAMLLLAEKGLLRKTMTAPAVSIESSLVCKVQNEQIIFRHPVTGKRVVLPAVYENVILDIGGKKYKMPQISRAVSSAFRREGKKASVWR